MTDSDASAPKPKELWQLEAELIERLNAVRHLNHSKYAFAVRMVAYWFAGEVITREIETAMQMLQDPRNRRTFRNALRHVARFCNTRSRVKRLQDVYYEAGKVNPTRSARMYRAKKHGLPVDEEKVSVDEKED